MLKYFKCGLQTVEKLVHIIYCLFISEILISAVIKNKKMKDACVELHVSVLRLCEQ